MLPPILMQVKLCTSCMTVSVGMVYNVLHELYNMNEHSPSSLSPGKILLREVVRPLSENPSPLQKQTLP